MRQTQHKLRAIGLLGLLAFPAIALNGAELDSFDALDAQLEAQFDDTDAPLEYEDGDAIYLPAMSLQLVERMVKPKRSHRNIADSEKRYLNYVLPLMKKTSAQIT